ncbi:Lrp/AsnC family transcriptional regulator [Sphingobium sp. CR2-8]|uniref:Lrp/AsnC family transcriptional regulator n=1 Tax=Sphingobium sp. CR2-8 TaxID=1306534 RepID=UPI002DBD3F2D|nr:Lrp/AsnC family transcriptional regulator [Sphingobium sp. CR2-8]MEC3909503.1 Lrp/AsnC family transcriptional regulator [Sphingobium sp. CR2-8]
MIGYQLKITDLKIVEMLRHSPRASHRAIATAVGLSEAMVGNRIRRLTDTGDIRVIGQRSAIPLGFDIVAHMDVTVVAGQIDTVARALAANRRFGVVDIVSGPAHLMVVALARNNGEIISLIENHLTCADGIQRVEINASGRTVSMLGQERPSATRTRRPQKLDSLDRDVIKLLRQDGRMSNREIARRLDIPEATARLRLQKMLSADMLQYRLQIHKRIARNLSSAYIGIDADPASASAVARKIGMLPGCFYSGLTLGRHTIFAYFLTSSREELYSIARQSIERIEGVHAISIREVLDVVKHPTQIGEA